MADNDQVRNSAGTPFTAATDELSDGAKSPKVSILDGTNSPTPIDPRTGNVAHDAADSGNPNKIGGQARTTNPAAVADADRVNFIADKLGKQVVVNSIRDLKGIQKTTITSSTSETTIITAV